MNIMNAHDFVDTTRNIDFVNEKLYGKQSISKVQLVALAIMAQKINGEYVKRGGKSDFVDIYDPELDETIQRFAKVKEANRNVMEILAENNSLITMDVMIEAHDMIKGLEMDFMFKVLGDNMNDFETSIHEFLAENDDNLNVRYHIGVVAYIPEYVKRDANKKELEERSVGSEYIGSKGDKVTIDIEIISKRQATAWAGWNVNAITPDGNRVSFFTTKDELSEMTGVFSITAKVKDCSTVWENSDIKETRLNYVKIL